MNALKTLRKISLVTILVLILNPVFAQVSTDSIYHEKLYYMCKIWGHAKYFHSEIAKGDINWDETLIDYIDIVKNSTSNASFNEVMIDMLNEAGDMQLSNVEIPEVPDSLNTYPNPTWINDDFIIPELRDKLNEITDKFRPQENVYVPKFDILGNELINLKYDSLYYRQTNFDKEIVLLALCRYWNIVNVFYPFKNQMDQSWNQTLREFIPLALQVEGFYDYNQFFRLLNAKTGDSNYINFSNGYNNNPIGFLKKMPFKVKYVQNKTVISEFAEGVDEDVIGVKIGDKILEVNGKNIDDYRDSLRQYVTGVTEATINNWIDRILPSNIISQEATSFSIRLNNATTTYTTQLMYKDYSFSYTTDNNSTDMSVDGCNIITMDPNSQTPEVYGYFWDFSAYEYDHIILDLRSTSYVLLNVFTYHIYDEPTYLFSQHYNDPYYPGRLILDSVILGGNTTDIYDGNIILLINENTRTRGEYNCLILEKFPNAIKIGSQTTSHSGLISDINLPFEVVPQIRTRGRYNEDGTNVDIDGILPDIEVKPTIVGIRNGKDELMEYAIQYAKNRCFGTNTSITDSDLSKNVILYPNPSSNIIHYEISESINEIKSIRVYDFIGNQLFMINQPASKDVINLSNYSDGLYLLKIHTEKGLITKKIVKQDN